MKISYSRRRVIAVAAVILLALFVLRPGASPLKSRIITSISAGVGRPVDIGSVEIRLLPWPGFDLENLVVYDDPAFGAEPILRASEVTAALRLTSLVRGRLEIARLELTEPSLNLVHSDDGRWNLAALLERTAHIPLAPTGKSKTEHRPAFPYIEAASARINFKNGAEKKPYALTNTDFSLWQDSENTWGVRLKGQPFRTDLNLNDTGQVQLNGTWQRAQNLRDTPLQINLEWKKAQLGQVTKFLTGNDKGWRGEIQVDVALMGTPSAMQVSSRASIDQFRRYDITSGKALHMAANCDGSYSALTHEFHEVTCSAPVARGLITMTGDLGFPGSHHYAVMVRAEDVPAGLVATLVERSNKNLPEDLEADGTIHGKLSMRENAATGLKPHFEGTGEIADLHLTSSANKSELGPQTIPFSVSNSTSTPAHARYAVYKEIPPEDSYTPHIEFGPFTLGAPRAKGPVIRAWMTRSGYELTVSGESQISSTLSLARILGLPVLPTKAEGIAQLDLEFAGMWAGKGDGRAAGFVAPHATGTAKLRNAQIATRDVGGPIDIVSADLQLLSDKIRVTKLNAKVAGTSWTGSIEMPRGCGMSCLMRFTLNANQITLYRLSEWVNPSLGKQPWYRVLQPSKQGTNSWIANLRASGRLTAERFEIHGLTATHASANLNVDEGKIQISDLNADFMGGKHRGEWRADFNAKSPTCKGSGQFSGVTLAEFAEAMQDDWVTGTADAKYEVSGKCPTGFWQSAEGVVDVEMNDGAFPHISFEDGADAFHVNHLVGLANLKAGTIEIQNATVDSAQGDYDLSGTASLAREVDIKLTRVPGGTATAGYTITGTLAEPQIAPMTGSEQARLKAIPSK